ncbi:hypothetical protein PV325_005947 [Microctonus aethiopoides]|nr:hypothetical protein PV325_005947 [Microctonus aethiopoides]
MPENIWQFTVTVTFLLIPWMSLFHFGITQHIRSNEINPTGLSSLEWGSYLKKFKGLYKIPNNFSHSLLRNKRYVFLNSTRQMPNKPYQSCISPGENPGHCRHLNHCVLEDFRKDFIRFLDYVCIIEHTHIGVCCPNNAKIVIRTNSLDTDNLSGFLPAIADVDDIKPDWEIVEETAEKSNTNNNMSHVMSELMRKPRGTRGCGMSTKSRTRVVGGQPADPKEWPWMVALIRKYADHYCGGVLITDRHVLTAAHCLQGVRSKDIKVRLGEYDFSKPDETRAQDFHISDVRIHEDFDPANYDNDIAIIKIHRPTIFNTYIWPICLPPTGLTIEDKSAIVIGWGSQYYAGPSSSILMEVPVPVWPHNLCANSLVQRIPQRVLCAGAYEGGRDSCQGDSGGPLLHQLANGRWVNIGIVSWGIRCGEPGHPGIYTSVSSYLDWIFANAIF